MPFFSEVREAFRDKRREELCADLQSLGIDAQMVPRGRVEENTYTDPILSLGVIDILDGPIRWVNVTCRLTSDEETTRHLVYGVPDPKVRPGFPEVRINAIPIRERERFWLSRRVTGVRWEGNDFGLGIVQHVWPNVLIPRAVLESLGVDSFEIRADPDRGCWILTVQDVEPVLLGPPRGLASPKQEWDCYQSIASHLLRMPLPLPSRWSQVVTTG